MIEIAREKLAETPVEGLSFETARTGDGSLPEGPFDAVLAFNLLHLVPGPARHAGRGASPAETRRPSDHQDALPRRQPLCPRSRSGRWSGRRCGWLEQGAAAARRFPLVVAPAAAGGGDRLGAGFDIERGATIPMPPSRFVVARRL
jgi:hypothetical protein